MEQKELEFLNSFTEKLSDTLVKQCTADKMLDGKMLLVEELNEKWRTSAPEYMVDAVPQIAEYPSAAIAWACYVGMGAAVVRDKGLYFLWSHKHHVLQHTFILSQSFSGKARMDADRCLCTQ